MRNLAVGLGNAPSTVAVIEALQLRRDDPLRAARELIGLCMCGSHSERLLGLPVTKGGDNAEAEQAAQVFLRAYAV